MCCDGKRIKERVISLVEMIDWLLEKYGWNKCGWNLGYCLGRVFVLLREVLEYYN